MIGNRFTAGPQKLKTRARSFFEHPKLEKEVYNFFVAQLNLLANAELAAAGRPGSTGAMDLNLLCFKRSVNVVYFVYSKNSICFQNRAGGFK
jgi:hypothetical protein